MDEECVLNLPSMSVVKKASYVILRNKNLFYSIAFGLIFYENV